jgi:hypothetical protein
MAREPQVRTRSSEDNGGPGSARTKRTECPGVMVAHRNGTTSCIVCLIDQRSVVRATHKSRKDCKGCAECAPERFKEDWGLAERRGIRSWLRTALSSW